jgi:arginase
VTIELIGVPFDGWGRDGAQARAAGALRDAGLVGAFSGDVVVLPDPVLPAATPARAPHSGLMNEAALCAMIETVHGRVQAALAAGRFPIVYGADCTVLLGAVPALRDVVGRAGLITLDAHEDTTSLDSSPDGEAANMEIGLLLGLTGQLAPAALRRRVPAVELGALAVLGTRDHELRRSLNVASLADLGVRVDTAEVVAGAPAAGGREAAQRVGAHADGWWLHLDVDVLSRAELASQRVPGDEDTPGGLSWAELGETLVAVLGVAGCRGWSISIYDPEQDPDGRDARRIVELVRDVSAHLP